MKANQAPRLVVDAFGDEVVVHQRPAVGDLPGVEPRDPRAEQQLDEQQQRDAERRAAVRRAGRSSPLRASWRRSSAVQTSPASRNKAVSRCAERRKWLTSVRFTSPDWTMYQPSAPWKPTSSSKRDEARAIAARDGAAHGEPDEGHEHGQPDQPPEQAVEPFPEIDLLEGGEVHPRRAVDLAIFGGRLVAREFGRPVGVVERRQLPPTRFHSVIDSPLSVSRVIPPTTTIANTSTATSSSQRAIGKRAGARATSGAAGAKSGPSPWPRLWPLCRALANDLARKARCDIVTLAIETLYPSP